MSFHRFPASFFTASSSPLRKYRYLDVPPKKGSATGTLLFLHGFPDTSFTWHHLLDHFSANGYRCLAPDLLGYGGTSKPDDLAQYTFQSMSKDLAALVRHALGSSSSPKVTVISHDWGAGLAWRFTKYHPELINGMCSVCIPYAAMHEQWISREQLTKMVPSFGYQAFFEDQKSTKIIQDRIEAFMRGCFSSPGLFTKTSSRQARDPVSAPELPGNLEKLLVEQNFQLPTDAKIMLGQEEFQEYIKTYKSPEQGGGGINGGLNWYRTRRLNFEDEVPLKDKSYPSSFPVLVVVPELDAALPPSVFGTLGKHVPHAERVDIPDCGHFVQMEQPQKLIQALEKWMAKTGDSAKL